MARIHWKINDCHQHLRNKISEKLYRVNVACKTLTYNEFNSWSLCLDTSLEPLFWFVDHFVKILGPAFVIIVVCLILSVIAIVYVCLLPFKYAESYFWTVYHLIFGHWLLTNVVFHYFKAAFTDPGHPPSEIPEVVSICKKCICPKPPRAHHCSVCDHCILKMDHHCPWLNNCVGHYNHRHFFLFCVYLSIGAFYVSLSAYPVFKEHFIGTKEISISGYFYPFYIVKEKIIDKLFPTPVVVVGTNMTFIFPTRNPSGIHFHHFIFYEFMLCSAVALAVTVLTTFHARAIHRAETSIEVHINRKDKKRLAKKGKVFRNPYDFGGWNNWKIFLGFTDWRSFCRRVLLPSSHKPEGDGLKWNLYLRHYNSDKMFTV